MLDIKRSCCLIGSTSLLIRCANILKMNNWDIKWIGSLDARIVEYCRHDNIQNLSDSASFKEALLNTDFDCLFSIVNNVILDKEMINAPKQFAINYHDALLPNYAGMHASFWALYHQEKQHGISWHIIDDGIDSGDIIIQKSIDITKSESALSLHSKCYEQAVITFEEMIDQIENDFIQPKPQDSKRRSYNAWQKRPQNACIINFDQSAETIQNQINAYNFGQQYENPIGQPKLLIEDKLLIIVESEMLKEAANGQSGSIDRLDENALIINTKDHKIAIKKLNDIYGRKQFLSELRIANGAFVNNIDPYDKQLSKQYELATKHEKYWVNKLLDLNVLEMPFVHRNKSLSGGKKSKIFNIEIDNYVAIFSINKLEPDHYLSLLILYLSSLSDQYNFDIPIQQNEYKFADLFSSIIPCKIQIDAKQSVKENLEIILVQLKEPQKRTPFVNDIVSRYPILRDNISVDQIKRFNLSIGVAEKEIELDNSSTWNITFLTKDNSWQISYPENEFNHAIAKSFIEHFQHFANQLQHNQDQTLNNISLLPKVEWEHIIHERNSRTIDVPKNKCIHHLFEACAIETPNEIAIVYGEESITYHDLNTKANLLANHLYDNGFQPKQNVGIYLHRNIEHIIAILGILKAGGCYVPLNPDYPLARLEVMIHEANIHHLITTQELLKDLEIEDINTLIWEEISFDVEQNDNKCQCSPSDLAYIMFTSGSSGRPKGVPISHFNVVNFLYGIRDYINLSSKRIGAVAAPFSFDVSVEEIFSTICFGGTAHIIPKDLLVQPKPLVDYLYRNKINVMFIIPTLLDKIADEFTSQTIQYLECILSGLQSKKNKSFKKFRNLSSEMKIINTYGPTEVTFGPCGYYYRGDELDELETPIGQQLANYEMYVVNSQTQVLPDYIPGELLIGGESVSKGYLNYPELNTQRFIETPFGGSTKKYRSGDLVYSDSKGSIHFIGRRDNQVKIRGFRIEIGEVENAISKVESIEKCIVLAKKVNQNYHQLIAYLLFKPNSSNSIELVKKGIEDELPDYAIPSFFIPIDEIPLFPNGKINFGKLPDPQQFVAHRNIKSPSSKIEQELVSIWQKVLGVASISTDDNFFEIGGDSLSAAEVIAEFQTHHKEKVSIAMFYNFSTIETFAAAFARDAGFFSAHPLIQLKAGEEDIPLFFIHGLNGSIAILNHIIDQLNVPNALYAFQASSQYHQNESIEKLAASYVELIAGQSIKKCILCGFSFGGILAFEMAHQLKLKDIDVKLITLDSKPIIMYKKQKKWFYRRLYVTKMMTWLLEGVLESIHLSWKNKSLSYFSISKNRFNKLKDRIEPEHLAEIGAEEENSISIYQEILLKSKSLVNKYQPQKYTVDLTLIKAMKEKEGFIGFGFSKNSWTYFTYGEIVVKPVNIHHYDFGEKKFAKLSASIIQDEAKSFNIV